MKKTEIRNILGCQDKVPHIFKKDVHFCLWKSNRERDRAFPFAGLLSKRPQRPELGQEPGTPSRSQMVGNRVSRTWAIYFPILIGMELDWKWSIRDLNQHPCGMCLVGSSLTCYITMAIFISLTNVHWLHGSREHCAWRSQSSNRLQFRILESYVYISQDPAPGSEEDLRPRS